MEQKGLHYGISCSPSGRTVLSKYRYFNPLEKRIHQKLKVRQRIKVQVSRKRCIFNSESEQTHWAFRKPYSPLSFPSALRLDKSWPWKPDIFSEKRWANKPTPSLQRKSFAFSHVPVLGKCVSASRNAVQIMSFKCLSFLLSHACGGSACLRRVNSIFTDLIYIKDVLDCNKLCF